MFPRISRVMRRAVIAFASNEICRLVTLQKPGFCLPAIADATDTWERLVLAANVFPARQFAVQEPSPCELYPFARRT